MPSRLSGLSGYDCVLGEPASAEVMLYFWQPFEIFDNSGLQHVSKHGGSSRFRRTVPCRSMASAHTRAPSSVRKPRPSARLGARPH
jgi:hypothetical protein